VDYQGAQCHCDTDVHQYPYICITGTNSDEKMRIMYS
jgi:hypothetical protein